MSSGGGSHAAPGSFARDVTVRVVRAVVLIVIVVVIAYVVFRTTRSSHHSTSAGGTTVATLPSASAPSSSLSSLPATSVAATTPATTGPVATTTAVPASTTTLVAVAHGTVTVVVLNGTVTSGAARYFTNKLGAAGYQTLVPLDASAATATSSLVLVTPTGTQAGGEAVAQTLGLPLSSVVTSIPAAAPIPANDTGGTDVVVLVGPNLASQVSAPATSATTGVATTATS